MDSVCLCQVRLPCSPFLLLQHLCSQQLCTAVAVADTSIQCPGRAPKKVPVHMPGLYAIINHASPIEEAFGL